MILLFYYVLKFVDIICVDINFGNMILVDREKKFKDIFSEG